MNMCEVYFIGSLVALSLSFAFFLKGVLLRRRYEDEKWRQIQAESLERR